MSDSAIQETEAAVSPLQWPENGDQWSDTEEGGIDMEECGLAAMAEEDEEINIYNNETFGSDMDTVVENEGHPINSLPQLDEQPPEPPSSPSLPSLSPSSPSFSPRTKPQFQIQFPPGLRGRGRVPRGGQAMAQMFEDPAVVTTVEGRQSLQRLDSSIVDFGSVSHWDDPAPDSRMFPSYGRTRYISGSVLQDPAIVYVMDSHMSSRGPNYPLSSSRWRRGGPRGSYSNRPFVQRCPPQMSPLMPRSPIISRQPFTPQQPYNQTRSFLSSSPRPCPSTPQPLTPKMMQLRFGANSPRPFPFYSPSSNPVHRFRFPGPVTQLHPQHRRLLSQRQPRSQRKPDWDPYCNIMSAKEKEWIIRLQMIQLQSENPNLDDYYYQEYYRRMEAKLAEEELGMRGKREPPKLTTPYVTKTESYTPVVHIEGSLGQVAVSTCFNPRRAIDAVTAHCPHEELKDLRQQRLDVLKKIEKLFMVLLDVEEGQRMKAHVLGEGEESRLMERTQRKVEYIFSQFQNPCPLEAGDEFLPCLLVSKGKRLMARLLPFLSRDAALKVLRVVTFHLPILMSRDTDESLPVLYPPLRTVIGAVTFSQLIGVLKDFTASSPDSSDGSDCLSLACQSKFGLSLLYALLSQGERLLSSDVPLEPSIGDFETWTDTVFLVASQLSQSALVEPLLLPSNLLTLFCRYLDKRTVHQLKSNIESATGHLAPPS
ncbi:protein PAT1 homolog 2 [Esox lucius]|uniref:mRNA decay factor PAT1 domain-containing protein n=1 Tax=Esox lucius TaxID=8010 RepID=A0A3P8Z6Z6_ESOLU|nr:protein PAT1 homolog 2 [Esox lucius]